MECRISSFLHLNLMISQKYIQLYRNIQLGKTWSKCMFELPNIVFNPTFTCFGCRRQSLNEKMEIIAKFLPHRHWEVIFYKCNQCNYKCNFVKNLKTHKNSLYKCIQCNYKCIILGSLRNHNFFTNATNVITNALLEGSQRTRQECQKGYM